MLWKFEIKSSSNSKKIIVRATTIKIISLIIYDLGSVFLFYFSWLISWQVKNEKNEKTKKEYVIEYFVSIDNATSTIFFFTQGNHW